MVELVCVRGMHSWMLGIFCGVRGASISPTNCFDILLQLFFVQ